MKNNKKGFAISTMLYGLVFVTIAVFYLIVAIVGNRNQANTLYVDEIRESLKNISNIIITFDNNFLSNDIYGAKPLNVSLYNYATTSPSNKTLTKDLNVKSGGIAEFTMNAGASGGLHLPPPEKLVVGRVYTWSVYLKASTNKSLNIGSEQGGRKVVNVTTNWQRFTHTFTAANNPNNYWS